MIKQTIEIHDRIKKKHVEVDAFVFNDTLAINQTYGIDRKRWTVTHLPTASSIVGGLNKKGHAVTVCKLIAKYADQDLLASSFHQKAVEAFSEELHQMIREIDNNTYDAKAKAFEYMLED